MFERCLILVCFLITSQLAFANMAEDLDNFQLNPDGKISTGARTLVNRYHFVLVGGFMNEIARSHYFDLNVQTIKEMGAEDVSVFFPSSIKSASRNRMVLRSELLRLSLKGNGKPIILIGHSKGGLESLATVLIDPELVDSKTIAEVVLLQSPVGGNSMVDDQGLMHKAFARSLFFAEGFTSLMTHKIRSVIEDRIDQLSDADREMLSRSVKYVISDKTLENSAKALKAAKAFAPIKGPNDGLVAKDDMWIPGFGTVLGDIPADHLEMIVGKSTFLGGELIEEKVKAFTKSLVLNILKSRSGKNQEYIELTRRSLTERRGALRCDLAILAL